MKEEIKEISAIMKKIELAYAKKMKSIDFETFYDNLVQKKPKPKSRT